jgi:hypothetical protein
MPLRGYRSEVIAPARAAVSPVGTRPHEPCSSAPNRGRRRSCTAPRRCADSADSSVDSAVRQPQTGMGIAVKSSRNAGPGRPVIGLRARRARLVVGVSIGAGCAWPGGVVYFSATRHMCRLSSAPPRPEAA